MQTRRLAFTELHATDKFRFSEDTFAVRFTNAVDAMIPVDAVQDPLLVALTTHLRPRLCVYPQPAQ